jgi:hypothetical protein
MPNRPNSQTTRFYAVARVGLAAWAAFSGLNAQAATLHDVKAAFCNTVLATYPDGRSQRIWLKADGAYEAIGRRGTPSAGTWSVKGEKVCLKQRKPFWSPISYCTSFPRDGDIGVTWTGKDLQGVPIKLTLVKRVQKPGAD